MKHKYFHTDSCGTNRTTVCSNYKLTAPPLKFRRTQRTEMTTCMNWLKDKGVRSSNHFPPKQDAIETAIANKFKAESSFHGHSGPFSRAPTSAVTSFFGIWFVRRKVNSLTPVLGLLRKLEPK
jgi:hypothetical protein